MNSDVLEGYFELPSTLVDLESVEPHHCELGRVARVKFDYCATSLSISLLNTFNARVVPYQLFEHQLAEILGQVLYLNNGRLKERLRLQALLC